LLIHAQVVQKLEVHIKIGASFYPNGALGGNINANLLKGVTQSIKRFSIFYKTKPWEVWDKRIC
jgi:hypothetical protein